VTRAVVFAYHDVGVRCLSALLAQGVEIALVVTVEDDSRENIWFGSVAELAQLHAIPVATPRDPNAADFVARVKALTPDVLFSFYYRAMLKAPLLELVQGRAYNMHGSLLPKYRGRAPVNWAVLHGERTTGATLHEMVEKPDAGRIVDQMAVPILPNDLAADVFRKVTVAAETVLDRSLQPLLDGTATLRVQDLAQGSYFGGRRPEDGRIDWSQDAWSVHNLVRAVAPPYPGAFCDVGGRRLEILRTWHTGERDRAGAAMLAHDDGKLALRCADGGLLRVLDARLDGEPLTPDNFDRLVGASLLALTQIH
jgi:methionyl-tRNA formyltransferase